MEHLNARPFTARICDHGVFEIMLDSPPVNALRTADYIALREAIERAGRGMAGCILLGARGRLFSAGGHLSERGSDGAAPDSGPPLALMAAIRNSRVPIVTRVHATAAGMGALIALMGDIVIAAPEARFLLPEIDTGAIGGFRAIVDLVAPPLARFMALTGTPLPAATLQRSGSIDRIVERAALVEEAAALAARVAKRRGLYGDPATWRSSLARL